MIKTLHDKKKLTARLSGYAAAAGALVALTPSIKGQVIYSGLQNIQLNMPDAIYELNMDGDTINDFIFQIHGENSLDTIPDPLVYLRYGWGYAVIMNPKTDTYKNSWIYRNTYITSTTSTSLGGTTTSVNTYPLVNGLGIGVQVDSLQSMWKNISYPYNSGVLGYGNFYSYWGAYSGFTAYGFGDFFSQEKYIGVRFYIGADQHYGWIRASLGDLIDPMTIIDWAYESTPGDSIITGAGDMIGPEAIIDAGLSVTEDQTITLSLSFNEKAYILSLSDLIITNGIASNFVEITPGKEFTFDVTAIGEGDVTASLPAGSVTDLIGNENELASESWIYNAPVDINLADKEGISIYPNPVNTELFIKNKTVAIVRIVSLEGKVVFLSEPAENHTIDMSHFNKGLYIIQIQDSEGVTQHKVIVE